MHTDDTNFSFNLICVVYVGLGNTGSLSVPCVKISDYLSLENT